MGFLNKDEILKDLPLLLKTVKENGLKIKVGNLTEDEWSKRTDYYIDFYASPNMENPWP